MDLLELSASHQNYLKTIWTLAEWNDTLVTASEIAQRAGVKISSASDAIKRLTALGYVEHTPYGAVTLTARGNEIAIQMVRRHRLLETYLVEKLGYTWDQVHAEADSLEHYVSDFFICRIDAALGHPSKDPHGDPIPHENGKMPETTAVRLSEIPAGKTVTIARIFDEDIKLLQYFSEHQVHIGSQIYVKGPHPLAEAVEYQTQQNQIITLGTTAAQSVYVHAEK